MNLSIDTNKSNLDIFDSNTTILEDNMINADDTDENVDIIDLTKSNNTLSHKSFTTIYDGLYNNMKNNVQL